MNYLKKYRQEAGLVPRTNENSRYLGNPSDVYGEDMTPTKETLQYLHQANRGNSFTMKTPVRKEPSARKDKNQSSTND